MVSVISVIVLMFLCTTIELRVFETAKTATEPF
jgi:hypothetical protein